MNKFAQLAAPGVRQLTPYQPGKPIAELKREYGVEKIIKLASNENPLGPSKQVLAAIQNGLADLTRYPDGNGFELKQALAARHAVDMSQITLGNGSSDPIEFVVRVFVQPGDEVLFSEHAFAMYPIVTAAASGKAVVAPAKAWGHDLAAMKAAITDRTRVIFIANPNNPTGTWLTGQELESFIANVPKSVIVVVDEAYFDYAIDSGMRVEGYPDTSQWLKRYDNLVVTRTFSKAYGLAGLRVGYSLSHPDVANVLNRIRPPFNVNSLALIAATVVLDDAAYLERVIATNVSGMQQFTERFKQLGLAYIPSAGNFISVDVGQRAAPIYDAMLRLGIIVRPVANYAMPNHLRISIGLEEENAACLGALERVLAGA